LTPVKTWPIMMTKGLIDSHSYYNITIIGQKVPT